MAKITAEDLSKAGKVIFTDDGSMEVWTLTVDDKSYSYFTELKKDDFLILANYYKKKMKEANITETAQDPRLPARFIGFLKLMNFWGK